MSIGKRQRFRILERDGFRCKYCGATHQTVELHVDHVYPKSLGGTDDDSNLVASCKDCNLGKSNVGRAHEKLEPLPFQEWPNDIEHPVYFANRQWVASDYGVESIDSYYQVPANHLLYAPYPERNSPEMYECLVRISEKMWVDTEAFIEAYLRAIDVLRLHPDPVILRRSIEFARKTADQVDWDLGSPRRLAKLRENDLLFACTSGGDADPYDFSAERRRRGMPA